MPRPSTSVSSCGRSTPSPHRPPRKPSHLRLTHRWVPARKVAAAAVTAGSRAGDENDRGNDATLSTGSGVCSSSKKPVAPWALTFDLRERETLWTEENQARLVRIVAGYQLNQPLEVVERRLGELAVLLPHVAARCAYIKPSTLAELLRDPSALVARLLSLRQLMPCVDISVLAAAEPELLLLRDLDVVRADLERLGQLLGDGIDIDSIVQQQPCFLDAELVRLCRTSLECSEVLEELWRLVPGNNPVKTLLSDPSWALRLRRGQKRLGDNSD